MMRIKCPRLTHGPHSHGTRYAWRGRKVLLRPFPGQQLGLGAAFTHITCEWTCNGLQDRAELDAMLFSFLFPPPHPLLTKIVNCKTIITTVKPTFLKNFFLCNLFKQGPVFSKNVIVIKDGKAEGLIKIKGDIITKCNMQSWSESRTAEKKLQ